MTALDDIAFLARSQNRVEVLETLSSGSYGRADLQAATGIPRATVGRIVNDFQARGLVTQRGQQYTASPLGEFLAVEFRSLLDGVETMRKLRRVIEWLPTEAFDFTLDHFADATITTPHRGDPTAPVRRAAELTRQADRIRFVSDAFVPPVYEAVWQRTVHEQQTATAVLSDDVIATIREDAQMVAMIREIIASGRASLYRCDGPCPYRMAIIDETVAGMLLLDDEGTAAAVIDTTDEAIRSWVAATIDAYQREAHPLDADAFAT